MIHLAWFLAEGPGALWLFWRLMPSLLSLERCWEGRAQPQPQEEPHGRKPRKYLDRVADKERAV